MLSQHAVLALNYSVVTFAKRHKSRENRLKLNIHYHKLCLAVWRVFWCTERMDNTDHRSVSAVHARMFITTKKKSLFHFVLELSLGVNMICHWADSGDGLSEIM